MTAGMCDVLIVDDDRETSEILASAIALHGFETHWADGGSRALGLFAEGLRPRLVLLDLSMPGMSGLDVAICLRGLPELRNIPIVFASGQRLSTSAARVLGARDFLPKPFRLSQVTAIVRRYLVDFADRG